MKQIKTILIYAIVLFTLTGCLDIGVSEDSNPSCTAKTSTISGTVIDNYTSQPIQDANITFSNFSFSAASARMTIQSDASGRFSFTDTGCSFSDNLFTLREAGHDDYDGMANIGHNNEIEILLFKTRDFNLIFDNSNSTTEDVIDYRHHYCIDIGPTCHQSGDYGDFTSTGRDTIPIQVAEGEELIISYDLNDNPRVENVIQTEGISEFVVAL